MPRPFRLRQPGSSVTDIKPGQRNTRHSVIRPCSLGVRINSQGFAITFFSFQVSRFGTQHAAKSVKVHGVQSRLLGPPIEFCFDLIKRAVCFEAFVHSLIHQHKIQPGFQQFQFGNWRLGRRILRKPKLLYLLQKLQSCWKIVHAVCQQAEVVECRCLASTITILFRKLQSRLIFAFPFPVLTQRLEMRRPWLISTVINIACASASRPRYNFAFLLASGVSGAVAFSR